MKGWMFAGSLLFLLVAGCLAPDEGQPTWEQIANSVAGGNASANNTSATDATPGGAGNSGGGPGGGAVTPPAGNASPGGSGGGPAQPCGNVQMPSVPPFNAELTTCQATCGVLPPEVKDMCTNSCYMKVTNSTGNPAYCLSLTMQQLTARCYSVAAIAKKDRCICSLVKDAAKKAECEVLYDSPVR